MDTQLVQVGIIHDMWLGAKTLIVLTTLVNIQTSIALMYETRGKFSLTLNTCVVIVSTVIKPMEILAGTAWMSIQNDIHDNMTISVVGM